MIKPIHGGDIYTAKQEYAGRIVDFSANINPLGIPMNVKQALHQSITACTAYPDPFCRELTGALAKAEDIPQEWILCGNGASDLIFRLVYALRPKTALVASPCFAEYEQALSAAGCAVLRHPLLEEDAFHLTESILSAITPEVDILFLCNPNNPTGQPIGRDILERILAACEKNGVFFALDECFIDFLDEPKQSSLKECLAKHPGLLLLRAFTKLYAIPGVRLGQCYCSDAALLEKMYACGSPWSVSVLAQAAGLAALRETDYVARTREVVAEQRRVLRQGLARLGCTVVGSHANYMFFRAPSEGVLEALRAKGILLRGCDNYAGLTPGWLRAAVRSSTDNALLLRTLKEVLSCP